MNTTDNIAAPASAVGGAITVIRISGPDAPEIGNRVWTGRARLSEKNVRRMLLGEVSGDPALAVYMRAPASYTGDDVVELHCHGGAAAARNALTAVLDAGCRMAEPGEFTFRAFVNGKVDLLQAEAVADLIASGSDAALKLAERQLAGKLSGKLRAIEDELLALAAECESRLDFPDEELEFEPETPARLCRAAERLQELLDTGRAGSFLRDGVDVTIAGRPNSGKSSLLNWLCNSDRAIVTPIPGTTRDTVEGNTVLRNLPVRLTDTAGLRESSDPVEQLGIERSFRAIAAARATFWMLDASIPELEAETAELLKSRPRAVVAVWNKTDLVPDRELPELPCPTVKISVLRETGLDTLLDAFEALLYGGTVPERPPEVAINARTGEKLRRALARTRAACDEFDTGACELAATNLRGAIRELGEITGRYADPDILEEIFSRFCIGK